MVGACSPAPTRTRKVRTPQPIIDKIRQETAKVLTASDTRKRLGDLGMEVIANTPAEFTSVIKSEIPRWAKLVKEAGIKLSD